MSNLKKIAPATYLLPKEGDMQVEGLIIVPSSFANDPSMEKPLQQVKNVATLPGIVGYSIAMPDIHWGYGFPIGGVAAMDAEEGVISPGGVGYDINCGVRLATIPLFFDELREKDKEALLQALFHTIPSGVGHEHKKKGVSDKEYQKLLTLGAKWSVGQGYGFEQDLHHTESHGVIEGADFDLVSLRAKERGRKQLGTIGSGNHFVEIGSVQKIFLPEVATAWGLKKGQLTVLIHSGSRGFGHQVCTDTLSHFIKKGRDQNLVDKQLVNAPLKSVEGKNAFATMAAAANFAFNNRQQILHAVREAIHKTLHIEPQKIPLLYDVCHNIAKFETHEVNGQARKLCVHRKGATRAYGPQAPELTPLFQQTGQPVLVPGDMGRASYICVGQGNPLTFKSSCHGAGREKSRIASMKKWRQSDPIAFMKKQGVKVMATSFKTIAEEMPDAYKQVDDVVEAVKEANLAKPVARLRPHLVLKG